MSYCRWSTDIKNTVQWEEIFFLLRNNVPYDYIKKLEHRRHAEKSDWYVFDNCNGFASIWHKRDTIDWDYVDLLSAYLTDTIQDAYEDPTQLEFIYEVVYEVLEDHYSE